MVVTITKDELDFDRQAAWRIVGQMLSKPDAVIGLSTGRTTVAMHRIVAELFCMHPFDVSRVTLFGVDEITNVPRSYSGACYTMLMDLLAPLVRNGGCTLHMPPTQSDDFLRECCLFEQYLHEHGGADLQMLGLGENGHIGFNQPGTSFGSTTWIAPLDPTLEERVRLETQIPSSVPLGGLTRGIKNIMQTRRIILVAKGAAKAWAVQQLVNGPVTESVPASILQLHPNCELLLDAEAAHYLS